MSAAKYPPEGKAAATAFRVAQRAAERAAEAAERAIEAAERAAEAFPPGSPGRVEWPRRAEKARRAVDLLHGRLPEPARTA